MLIPTFSLFNYYLRTVVRTEIDHVIRKFTEIPILCEKYLVGPTFSETSTPDHLCYKLQGVHRSYVCTPYVPLAWRTYIFSYSDNKGINMIFEIKLMPYLFCSSINGFWFFITIL